jgi:hypothetical protein
MWRVSRSGGAKGLAMIAPGATMPGARLPPAATGERRHRRFVPQRRVALGQVAASLAGASERVQL